MWAAPTADPRLPFVYRYKRNAKVFGKNTDIIRVEVREIMPKLKG
jgi:hypothetical protein